MKHLLRHISFHAIFAISLYNLLGGVMERNKNISRLKAGCTLISFHKQKVSIIPGTWWWSQEEDILSLLDKG